MNQRTEPATTAPEFSADFVRLLVALTGATLVLVFVFEHFFYSPGFVQPFTLTLFPWVFAGGHEISIGLSEFAGHSMRSLPFVYRASLVVDLLLGLVLGPTLLLFGWRQVRLQQEAGTISGILNAASLMLIVGGIITFALAIPSVPAAVVQRIVSNRLIRALDIQSDKDAKISDITLIASDMRQYRILPKRIGGGEGSYLGYHLPAAFAKSAEGRYSTAEVSGEEVTLKAESAKNPGAAIRVKITKLGKPTNWEFAGEFQ